MALARAALRHAGEVAFVLPRVFPHKEYEGPTFEQRLDLLRIAVRPEPRFSLASVEGGLFIDITRALRVSDPLIERVLFVCGRDAAERIVNWDYTGREPIEEQMREYGLLVAPRGGIYVPPSNLSVTHMEIGEPLDDVSSSEVRRRIKSGHDWRHLLAPGIEDDVIRLYV